MGSRPIGPGDIIAALFPEHRPGGREQEGYRPAVVVALPEALGTMRFPLLVVVPLTSDKKQAWASRAPRLYPRLAPGAGGLRRASVVLLDQARSIGVERMYRHLGRLSEEEYEPVRTALQRMLG